MAPAVEAHHHAAAAGVGLRVEQVPGQAGGGPAHRDAVHAHGPRGHGAAQAGRAELEPTVEAAGELGVVVVEQAAQLGARLGIGIVLDPRVDAGGQLGRDAHRPAASRSSGTSGRAPTWPMTSAAASEPSWPQRASGSPLV